MAAAPGADHFRCGRLQQVVPEGGGDALRQADAVVALCSHAILLHRRPGQLGEGAWRRLGDDVVVVVLDGTASADEQHPSGANVPGQPRRGRLVTHDEMGPH